MPMAPLSRVLSRIPSRFHRSSRISSLRLQRNYAAPADRAIPAAKQKYVPTSGEYPKGFLAGSAYAGVKASNTKYDDVALVVSEEPCTATAIFTQNVFKAAPVQLSQRLLQVRQGVGFHGVIVNSGCANAVTGSQGLQHAEAMVKATDAEFGRGGCDSKPSTLVMSTGVIGQPLPIDRITHAIPQAKQNLGSTHEHWLNAANAICTTDTFPKLISRAFTLPSHPETTYRIAGMTKGAGMIHPNMATLLAVVCTDVRIEPSAMRSILRIGASRSFNCISVDGDTSTNDTVAFFANGAASPKDYAGLNFLQGPHEGNVPLNNKYISSDDLDVFQVEFLHLLQDLAKLVVRDGEGATKFVTIRVQSDHSRSTAKSVATSIARSALVKTALYGKDANWGRILCAIGNAYGLGKPPSRHHSNYVSESRNKARILPHTTSVSFVPADGSAPLKLVVNGEPQNVDEARAKQILEMEDLEILVSLKSEGTSEQGKTHETVLWTCDLSHEYVTINGDYRT